VKGFLLQFQTNRKGGSNNMYDTARRVALVKQRVRENTRRRQQLHHFLHHRRIAKIEREKRLRRNTITMVSAVAACLVLLIGASLAMPGIAASIRTGDYVGFETAASIFHDGAALGYIVIGLLAFLLGVCVTVLCFLLRQMNREDRQDEESEDVHGAD
jgi:hypothetical protein